MCLVLLSFRNHPEFDVLLAGNRDEFKGRPSAPPALIHHKPRIWAGRDLRAGGTWMGRNEAGMMAALTNRRSDRPEPDDPLSRGDVVMALLREEDPAQAGDWFAGQPMGRYRPFNVVFGNRERFYAFSPEDAAAPRRLAPGYYALSNSSLDDASWPKVRRSRQFLDTYGQLPAGALVDELMRFLGDATPPDQVPSGDDGPEAERGLEVHGAFGAVFIRHPEYGTVSSSIYTAGATENRTYYADGKDLERDAATAFRQIPLED